jgi:hypothetical protein
VLLGGRGGAATPGGVLPLGGGGLPLLMAQLHDERAVHSHHQHALQSMTVIGDMCAHGRV